MASNCSKSSPFEPSNSWSVQNWSQRLVFSLVLIHRCCQIYSRSFFVFWKWMLAGYQCWCWDFQRRSSCCCDWRLMSYFGCLRLRSCWDAVLLELLKMSSLFHSLSLCRQSDWADSVVKGLPGYWWSWAAFRRHSKQMSVSERLSQYLRCGCQLRHPLTSWSFNWWSS